MKLEHEFHEYIPSTNSYTVPNFLSKIERQVDGSVIVKLLSLSNI